MALPTAVLLCCHGTVEREEDIAAFIRNIRRGRPAPAKVVDEVTSRFRHIGGSPFMRISHQQAAALEQRLSIPVRAAGRMWHPYPKDVLQTLHDEGIRRIVSLPLAPQSTHIYNAVVRAAAEPLGMTVLAAPSYGTEPQLISAFADAIQQVHGRMPTAADERAIVFTAHSLPQVVVDKGDPYERDFRAMADAVAAELKRRGVKGHPMRVAFQSQGLGGGDWLGPDLLHTFGALQDLGVKQLLIAPIGFVAEHIETLYDIDVEAKQMAVKLGFATLERMPALDTRQGFIDALEAVARRLL